MKEVADLKQNKTKQKAECSTSGAFIFFWRVHKQPLFWHMSHTTAHGDATVVFNKVFTSLRKAKRVT